MQVKPGVILNNMHSTLLRLYACQRVYKLAITFFKGVRIDIYLIMADVSVK